MDGMVTLVTAPTVEPVDLADAKLHMRVDADDEDGLIAAQVEAARHWGEAFTRRAFVTQTWEMYLDCFPDDSDDVVELPFPPLKTVDSVKYYDGGGTLQTWAAQNYVVTAPAGPTAERGTIQLAYGVAWPMPQVRPNAIVIRFTCGYGASPSAIPAGIRAGLLLYAAELYKTREQSVSGIINKVPMAAESLLSPYRSLRAA